MAGHCSTFIGEWSILDAGLVQVKQGAAVDACAANRVADCSSNIGAPGAPRLGVVLQALWFWNSLILKELFWRPGGFFLRYPAVKMTATHNIHITIVCILFPSTLRELVPV
jgi:hypothetical protein